MEVDLNGTDSSWMDGLADQAVVCAVDVPTSVCWQVGA